MRDNAFLADLAESGMDGHRGRRWPSILRWFAFHRERIQLRDLSEDTLRDCGLRRIDIEREIRKLL